MTLAKFDRRAAIALWLQGRRRKRAHFTLLPGPVLTGLWDPLLTWTWDGPDPYKWNVWLSWDGGVSWMMPEDYWHYGASRQFAPDGGSELYFIVGVDEFGREITEHSNIVRPDDAGPPPPTLLTDLLAYWSLEETAWSTRADSHENMQDLFEWDYYGGLLGNEVPVNQTSGVLGYASSYEDDSYNTGLMAPAFAPWNTSGDFTISGWFKFTANMYGGQAPFNIGNNVAIGVLPYTLSVNFWVRTNGTPNYFQIDAPVDSVVENTWTHVVAVRSGSTLKLYLNGSLAASGTTTDTFILESNPDVHVGCAPYGYPMLGALDEFGLWQRALSDAEIGQLYNYGSGLAYDLF